MISQSSLSLNEIDEKKQGALHIDVVENASVPASIEEQREFTKEEERKIIRRIDMRLVLSCGMLNMVALMDRTNLGAAAIAGMTKDLKLNVGYRYSLIILIFFVTYTLAQPPTTVLCRKAGPRNFLAATALLWGVLMVGFGLAKNWVTLIPLRLILGLCEAGFFPGSIYLISTWYVRYEVQKRYSVFYTIGIVANACSGILAFGLTHMNGIGGLAGWRWIFLVEGIITFVIGVIAYFTLLDFPDQVAKSTKHFLGEKEIKFIIQRIVEDRNDADVEPFNFKKWIASGADPKVWGFFLIVCCCTTVSYSLQYFLPVILHSNMGFSIGTSQCLLAPPYGFAVVFIVGSGWAGDKYRIRGPIIIFNAVVGLIGVLLMGFTRNNGVRYFGVFLLAAGVSSILPTSWAYQGNNIRGQWKRAFCSATLVGAGGIGGIAGGLVFRSQDAPDYRPGMYAAITANVIMILVVIILTVYFRRENRKADEEGKILEGDANFRYTI